MRKEILDILSETNKLMEEKEKNNLIKKINENTDMLEENIYRVLSSKYLDEEDRLNVVVELSTLDILEDSRYKKNLDQLNESDNILIYKLDNDYLPVYYKKLLDEFIYEGFAINFSYDNKNQYPVLKYSISMKSEYYKRFMARNLSLK